jgi:hypothetical protein
MDTGIQKAVEALHASPLRASISTTGAGGQVIGWCVFERHLSHGKVLSRAPDGSSAVFCRGSSFNMNRLLAVPGASNTVLEATVPYAYTSLDEHLKRVDSNTAGV